MAADESNNDNTQSFIVLVAGIEVSHYRIIKKIGAGGMGEVYLAEDTKLKREVAIKFLPAHLCGDEDYRARFVREARAVAALSHPNIVTIHDVGEFNNRPYFAMENVKGETLKDVIKKDKLITDEAINYAMQICEGLQEAHEAGITHRDIKPGNIIIDSKGRARLLDFGLAMMAGEDKLTQTGSTLGTVGYMSPEQITGTNVDHRSDIFSVGVILYEMLTGRRPFEGDNDAAVVKAITSSSPEPVARFKSGTTGQLQSVIDKALSKDMSIRYQHADGMLADLKRLQTESNPHKKIKISWWVAVTVIAVAVAIVLAITKPWQNETTSDNPDKIMLAVLPFENLGDPEDEYFADGITEEITSKLSKVKNLGVIGSISAKKFKNTEKPITQIGSELGVDYLLTGTIRWQKGDKESSLLRVIPQLIKVSDASNIWSDIYEDLAAEIFTVQSSIANQVVGALDIALVDSEKRAIENRRTNNLEAYELFIRARDYYRTWETGEDIERAISLFEKAIELDSTFVDAWTELSNALAFCWWAGYDNNRNKLDYAKRAALNAAKFDTQDSYSHLAMGYYYYYSNRDYQKALDEFKYAEKALPSDHSIKAAIGYVLRRMGRWEESLEYQIKATQIEPLNASGYYDIIITARNMRRFDIAEKWLNKGLSLFPDYAWLHSERALISFAKFGNPKMVIEATKQLPGNVRNTPQRLFLNMQASYWLGDFYSAIDYARRFIDVSSTVSDTGYYFTRMGDYFREINDSQMSRFYYDSAIAYFDLRYGQIEPLNTGSILPLGIAYAELGYPQEAVRLAKEQASMVSISIDALSGPDFLMHLAQTYVRVGEYDKAVVILDTLLSVPSEFTVPRLLCDYDFLPLHNHPHFQELIEKYEKKDGK